MCCVTTILQGLTFFRRGEGLHCLAGSRVCGGPNLRCLLLRLTGGLLALLDTLLRLLLSLLECLLRLLLGLVELLLCLLQSCRGLLLHLLHLLLGLLDSLLSGGLSLRGGLTDLLLGLLDGLICRLQLLLRPASAAGSWPLSPDWQPAAPAAAPVRRPAKLRSRPGRPTPVRHRERLR